MFRRIQSYSAVDNTATVDTQDIPLPLHAVVQFGERGAVAKVISRDTIRIDDPETRHLVATGVLCGVRAEAEGLYLADSPNPKFGKLRKGQRSPATDAWGFPLSKSIPPSTQRRNRVRAYAGLFGSELANLQDAIRRSE